MPLSKYLITFFIFLVSQQAISACLDGNCTNGTGKYQWASGNTYEGSFVNRKRNGKGTFIWVSGEKYIGEYKDGKMHGQGTFHYDNGDVYTGSYSNNKRHGKGLYRWPNNSYFEGTYVNGSKQGEGKLVLQDGTITEGIWENDAYVDKKTNNIIQAKKDNKKVIPVTKTSKKKTQPVIPTVKEKIDKPIPTPVALIKPKASPQKKAITIAKKAETLPPKLSTATIKPEEIIAKSINIPSATQNNNKLTQSASEKQANTTNLPTTDSALIQSTQPQNDLTTASIQNEVLTPQTSEEKFPMSFGGNWFLNKSPDLSSSKNECFITSKIIKLFDGYTDTKFFLRIFSTEIQIKTDSNIDLSYPEVGIHVDTQVAHQIMHLTTTNTATVNEHYRELINQLLNGQQVTIKLGFWPTWPITKTRSIQYDLEGFNSAYQMLQTCK